jgi:hypothetical protein
MGGACPLMSVILGDLDFFKWGEDVLTISRKVVEGLIWLYEGLSLSEYPRLYLTLRKLILPSFQKWRPSPVEALITGRWKLGCIFKVRPTNGGYWISASLGLLVTCLAWFRNGSVCLHLNSGLWLKLGYPVLRLGKYDASRMTCNVEHVDFCGVTELG